MISFTRTGFAFVETQRTLHLFTGLYRSLIISGSQYFPHLTQKMLENPRLCKFLCFLKAISCDGHHGESSFAGKQHVRRGRPLRPVPPSDCHQSMCGEHCVPLDGQAWISPNCLPYWYERHPAVGLHLPQNGPHCDARPALVEVKTVWAESSHRYSLNSRSFLDRANCHLA